MAKKHMPPKRMMKQSTLRKGAAFKLPFSFARLYSSDRSFSTLRRPVNL